MKLNKKRYFPICTLTPEEVKNSKVREIKCPPMTLEDYYKIEDVINSLERLREYQMRDFLGRWKIF